MFHHENRQAVFATARGALIVLTAYEAMQLSGDMEAPFLQESSFWWVSGIEKPGWKVILDGARQHTTLVRPARSQVDVIFNGDSDDAAMLEISQADEIIAADEFEARLRQLARKHTVVQTLSDTHRHEFAPNPAQRSLTTTLHRVFRSVQDCGKTFVQLRACKRPEELARLERAVALTTRVFGELRDTLGTLKSEQAIEGLATYRFRAAGAAHAYAPIVAAGGHACTLHYTDNTGSVGARDMVLIDIGARVDGYSADITRTYCRRPTKRQQAVHAAVEQAHHQIIDLIAPGVLVADYIRQSDEIMKQALESIGLLDDTRDTETFRRYFPHAVSHGLGVDTHDSLGAPRYFMPGMVLTVEPGIYIPEEAIGVRIEDDILVTDTGHRNLSGSLPTGL